MFLTNTVQLSSTPDIPWRLTSSRITTVSLMCLCQKCTLITIRVNARPLHPLTGLGL